MKTALFLAILALTSCAQHVNNAQAAFYRAEAAAISNPGNFGARLNYGMMSYLTGAPMRGGFGTGYNPYLSRQQNAFLAPVNLP